MKMEIATTFGSIIERDESITSLISKENLAEIETVIRNTIKYLTNYSLIFLQKIDGRWYVN